MKVEAGDEVLTLKEAAERLEMSAGTLRLQVRAGKMAATLAGKTYLVMASEVERYRRDHRKQHGFASPDHPFHGKRPPRKDASASATLNHDSRTPRSGGDDTESG